LTKLAKNDEGIGATLFLPLTPTVGVQDAPREFGGTVRAAGEPARAGSCRGSGGPGTRIVARPPKENSVLAKGVEEVQGLFRFSRTLRVPMTFRAAGTSLSGQAVTDGILVEVSRHWREMRVEEGGRKVRVQPGVIGGHVNQALKAYRAKMGPDPASIRRPRWTGTRGSWTTWSAWWCGSMTGRSRASMGLGATWYDERWCG